MNAVKPPDFFELVSSAEGDMRKVYDHAYLLYDHLSRPGSLTEDEKGALIWPAGDLMQAGEALRVHCDAMYVAAKRQHATVQPALASPAPIVDPSKLTVKQMFGLFQALGTVFEVMDGLLCQPRFNHNHDLNEAGEMLDRLQEVVGEARDAIRIEVSTRTATREDDLSHFVFFAAEEWTDGSCNPGPALKGLTTALTDLGKAVSK